MLERSPGQMDAFGGVERRLQHSLMDWRHQSQRAIEGSGVRSGDAIANKMSEAGDQAYQEIHRHLTSFCSTAP